MISKYFVLAIYAFIYAITSPFRLAPDVSLPVSWVNAINTGGGYVMSLDNFLPMGVIFGVLVVFVAYESAYFAIKLVNWVIRKIPGIS